jgi:hypothetical protein
MQDAKKRFLPFIHRVPISKEQCPNTSRGRENEGISLRFGSWKPYVCYYVMYHARICFVVGIVSRYEANPGSILKELRIIC